MTRSDEPSVTRFAATLGLVLAALAGSGCVSVKPLDEARLEVGDRLVTVGDQQVYVEQEGSGEPVVLLHGFGASSFSWRKVLPELAGSYRVVAPDLSGFGWTERPDELESYTRQGQLDLILGLLDSLGIAEAHFIGHSYGGALTMALAGSHPDRVRSIILVDSAAIDYPQRRRKRRAALPLYNWTYVRGLALRKVFIRRLLERSYHDDTLVTADLVEAYRDRLRVEGAARAYRGLTRPRAEPAGSRPLRYQDIEVPALVVWGAEDALIAPEAGRAHAELLPDQRFVVIQGAGHSPMEETPQRFLTAVTAFLEEIDARNSVTGYSFPPEKLGDEMR